MARVAKLCLALALTFVVVTLVGGLEKRGAPMERQVRDVDVELDHLPSLSVSDLSELIAFNRDAAAQVARVGLTPLAQRPAAARLAARWMRRSRETLPQVQVHDYSYTARQRAILDVWAEALNDYAAGRAGSLARVRAISQANEGLYANMMTALLFSTASGTRRRNPELVRGATPRTRTSSGFQYVVRAKSQRPGRGRKVIFCRS